MVGLLFSPYFFVSIVSIEYLARKLFKNFNKKKVNIIIRFTFRHVVSITHGFGFEWLLKKYPKGGKMYQ